MNAVDFVPTQRETLAGFIGDIERLEALFASWDETQRGAVDAYRLAIESLQAEAFRRLVRGLKADPAALDSVRPMLASHGGDVELVAVRPPVIEVRFTGACDGCPASALTFHGGVKKAVEEACPEITDILQLKGAGGGCNNDSVRFVSPFALGAVDGWHLVCRLDEIPQGDVVTRTVGGENVILSRQGAIVSCFQNACAHLGMEIDAGEVADGIITCPWHGFQYDLTTGECLTAPEVQLQAHMVKVTGNRVEVRLAK